MHNNWLCEYIDIKKPHDLLWNYSIKSPNELNFSSYTKYRMVWDNCERVSPIWCQAWWQFLIYTTHSAWPPFWLSVSMTLFCELSASGLRILWMTSWRHVFRKNDNNADHQCKLRLYLHNSIHHPHILSYIDMWNCFPYLYNQHYHDSRQCRIHIHQHLKVELQPQKCRVVHKTSD